MSLLMAVKCGRIHQTRLLLDIGTDPNISTDKDSKTSLMQACFIEKQNIAAKIARMLIDKGAVVSTKDRFKRTALSYACMNGKEKIVEMLLEDIEYDINEQDEEGNTPLMYAAMSGNAKALCYMLKKIMKYRLSVDLRNKKGFSAYLLAAKMGHFYCAHILKTEGFASDGIRDTEYFLSDKEWIKKVRRDISRMQLDGDDIRIMGSRSACTRTPRVSLTSRPKTSLDFIDRLESPSRHNYTRRTVTDSRLDSRTGSRITARNETPHMTKNSWIDIADGRRSRVTSATSSNSENSLMLVSESSDATEIVPCEARTKTPDLHAILSHYLDKEAYKPVKMIPRKGRNVQFSKEARTAPSAGKSAQSTLRQRKQSRQSPKPKRRGVLTT
ncbi:2-5A-dependent ribonuclease-like [Actinia tenebrosa]|uniref:2-5A-dependent ribonuclease-like n=1 Tax=Actinia tenebrosa TaxID=6105 RepID=A0A6P8J6M3_ACTTE|nr:2-5A-dependent ribonuclease-like [Actinia tenebrosa]